MVEKRTGQTAVAPIVGFLLVVSIVTSGVFIVQTSVFDPLNFDREIEHHGAVLEGFEELTSQTQDTVDSGVTQSSQIDLSVNYPAQPVPPFSQSQSIRVRNVTGAVEFVNMNKTGSSPGTYDEVYSGTYLKMDPQYVEYSPAGDVGLPPSVVSELGIVGTNAVNFSRAQNGNTVVRTSVVSQNFVKDAQNQQLFIPELRGTRKSQITRESVSVSLTADGSPETQTFKNDTSDNRSPEMIVKTRLSEEAWERLFENSGETVTNYDRRFDALNQVTIGLTDNEYEVQTSRVEVELD